MRHRVFGYKLGRDSEHRRAMFRNLAAGLFQHGQITTTVPKAKAVQPFVEKLITLAKRGDLHARRRAIALLQDRQLISVVKGGAEPEEVEDQSLIQKLFSEIGPKYADRPGGYTRIVRLARHRLGDGGDLVVLQLVGDEEGPNVSGRGSRRRAKQDNRTAFAARLRKGEKADQTGNPSEPAPEAEAEVDAASAAVATEEAPPAAEAPDTAPTQVAETDQADAAPDATTDEEKKDA